MSDFDRFDYPRHDPWSNSSSSSQWTGSSHWDHHRHDHWRDIDRMTRMEPSRDHVVINPATGLPMHGLYGTGLDATGSLYGMSPDQHRHLSSSSLPITPNTEKFLKRLVIGGIAVIWSIVLVGLAIPFR